MFHEQRDEYMKAKSNVLETNSMTKNSRQLHRGLIDFKKGCQPRTNVVNDEKGDLFRIIQYFGQVEEIFLSAIECTCG
jgi:hypothetical protein